MNRLGICLLLGSLVGCGAEGLDTEGEQVGAVSEALVSTRVVASDTSGNLYGSSSGTTTFSAIALASATQAASVEGGGGVADGDYYVSKTGQLYERTATSQWEQKFGAVKFVDITTGGGLTLALNDAGRILRKQDAQSFEYAEELQVRENPKAAIVPVSRIDACANGTIWAVSSDGLALYRYDGMPGVWVRDALSGIGGLPNTVPTVLDVGCDSGEAYIVAARAPRPGGVFRRHHGAWVKIAAGQALFSASRVDTDSSGNVWFVGADSFNGPKLWRTDYLGSNLAFANVANPFDVGS
jgi:hypothetical protein